MKNYSYKLLGFIFIIALSIFLRFYRLSSNPPSLYWEEAALGYDAYSILQTGRDHHGNPWPIVAFESFGDWKPSLYFYAAIPSITIFGLTPLGVRLPSALAGVLTVWLVYLIVSEFTKGSTKKWIALGSAGMLAIMPWHILISRVGFETNLGLFLIVLGSWLFFRGIRVGKKWSTVNLCISSVAFGLSMYAYHGNRVLVPLLGLGMGLLYWKDLKKKIIGAVGGLGIFIILGIPILIKIQQPQISQRFAETSAFTILEPILTSNEAIIQDGNTWFAHILHHRYWYYAGIFIKNYISHFDPTFLFISGDINPRHSIGLDGQLYWVMGLLAIIGVIGMIWKKEGKLFSAMMLWLLLSPVAAGLTKAVPHALRALPMVVPISVFAGYGIFFLLNKSFALSKKIPNSKSQSQNNFQFPISNFHLSYNKSLVLIIFIIAFLSLELFRFWDYYIKFYPVQTSQHWQYGYQELMEYVGMHKHEYDQIVVTREHGRPAMYYWFFNSIDPRLVQAWDEQAQKDQGEYLQFENIYFGIEPEKTGRQLIVVGGKERLDGNLLKEIFYLNGEVAFRIYER